MNRKITVALAGLGNRGKDTYWRNPFHRNWMNAVRL